MAKKESYYFSHDSNARNDERLIAVRMRFKWEGYGLFWAIVEKMRDATDYILSKNYNLIAYDLRSDASVIKSIIEDFGLFDFTDDGKGFYSKRLKENMEYKDAKSNKARESASKRWDKNKKDSDGNANAMQTQCKRNAMKEKKRKEKERKENNSRGDSPEPPKDKFSNFSTEIKELYKRIYKEFDSKHIPKTDTGIEKWLNVLRLANKDYSIQELENIIVYARNDSFWKGTFLNLNSLRKKNTAGVMKIDSIVARMQESKAVKIVKPKLNLKKGENI